MNKEMIERIALEVAQEVTPEFVWEEGCNHENGVCKYELYEFAQSFLARIDAERGKDAVGMVVDDFDGWTKVRMFKNQPSGTRLFLSQVPTIPEGIVLFGRTLDGNTILPPGSNKEGIALYSILDFAQGERK